MGEFSVAKMQLFPAPGRKAGCGVGGEKMGGGIFYWQETIVLRALVHF